MKKKIISILLNQYFISGIITLGIIFLLPNYFSKYKVELIEEDYSSRKEGLFYFEDLNNDRISEKIYLRKNNTGNASFEVKNNLQEVLNQWNFEGKLIKGGGIGFFDTDKNGFKEVFLITQKEDSLFLTVIEPFFKNGIHKKNIFVDVIANHSIDNFVSGAFYKADESLNEVFFIVNSGFNGAPRRIYKYNIDDNEVIKSPHLTNYGSIRTIEDINNDGKKEVFVLTYSAANKIDSVYTKRTDESSWLTVLDNNLQFLFEPIEFKTAFSSISPLPFGKGKEKEILCLFNSRDEKNILSELKVYSNQGELRQSVKLPPGDYHLYNANRRGEYILHRAGGQVFIYDSRLKAISEINLLQNFKLYPFDIDMDDEREWISLSKNKNLISIYRNNLKQPVTINFPKDNVESVFYGVKNKTAIGTEIYFQSGQDLFVYSYAKNTWYYLKYLVYLLLYGIVLGFILLTLKGQKIRLEKKLALQAEIAEYQIKTIKNQVDPHFVFNAINTISSLMLTDDKLKADEFICKFSDLMRKTLEYSDKITCTLQEEIEYVEKFIQLQQIRFNNSFQYKIEVDESVQKNTIVPKHVLYSYVENAIKHGLTSVEKGLLSISIFYENTQLVLQIEDNGSGFKKGTKKNSTGNGILIMEKIYLLYSKLYQKKIKHQINEIFNTKDKVIGVSVKVFISK